MKTTSSYLIMLMSSLLLSGCLRRSADEDNSEARIVAPILTDEIAGREADTIDNIMMMSDADDELPSVKQYSDVVLDKFQELFCNMHFACDDEIPTSLSPILARTSTKQECREDLAQVYIGYTMCTQEEVDTGLIEYRPEAASRCIEVMSRVSDEMTCSELQSILEEMSRDDGPCTDVLIGLQPVGAPCTHDRQCANNEVCELSGEMMCEIGQCASNEEEDQQLSGAGESCEDRACESGLYCGQDEICAPARFVAEGETCNGDYLFCARGLVCSLSVRGFTHSYTCRSPIPEGEPCFVAYACQRGLTCRGVDLDTVTAGQCAPLGGEGAPCGFYERYECQPNLTCQLTQDQPGVCTSEFTECPIPSDDVSSEE